MFQAASVARVAYATGDLGPQLSLGAAIVGINDATYSIRNLPFLIRARPDCAVPTIGGDSGPQTIRTASAQSTPPIFGGPIPASRPELPEIALGGHLAKFSAGRTADFSYCSGPLSNCS